MPVINNVQNQRNTPALYTDVLASQPAAGFSGRLFVSSDTLALYRDNGTSWDLIGGPGTGTITGSGTAGKLTKFTGAAVIGDSIITESGAALTIAGTVTATSLIKSGGTSTEFLKADGSIDSSTYVTAGGNVTFGNVTANSFIKSGGTSAQFLKADGSIDSNTYLTAAAAAGIYLPLAGGTMTGAINMGAQNITNGGSASFTTGNFTGNVTAGSTILSQSGMSLPSIIEASSLTGQDAVFVANGQAVTVQDGVPALKTGIGSKSNHDFVFVSNSILAGTISATNQSVVWVNTITSTGFIKSGGIASQFLKADGSVDNTAYLSSIQGTANRITITGASTVDISVAYVGQSSITTLGTIVSGVWNGTVITVPFGGTGLATLATGRVPYGNGVSALNSSSLFVFDGTSLGVGTASPNIASATTAITISGGNSGSNKIASLELQGSRSGESDGNSAVIRGLNATNIIGQILFSKDGSAENSGSILFFTTNAGAGALAMTIKSNQIISTTSRVNINGAADNSNFQLNVSGCTYTNSFSPTASTKTTNWTIGDNTTYIFTGGAGVTATFENPTITNKLIIIKNYSVNTLTIASFNGTTNGIVDFTNTVVASVSLLTGQTAIFQQSGGTHTFQIK